MKRVLLVGDSIRMSYNARVTELLAGKAEVWGPEENCRFAKYTLWSIGEWMDMGGKGKPDIIHWNNGIWDTYRVSPRVEPLSSIEEYMNDMKRIYGEMKRWGAQVIFATTTPVGDHFLSDKNDRIDEYNAAITEFMRSEGVPINDLNAAFRNEKEKYLGPDLLHLNDDGVEKAAQQVAAFIEQYL